MKSIKYNIPVGKIIGLVLVLGIISSCNNDDDGLPIIEPSKDYLVLKTLYDANPDNTLDWDLLDISMESWEGVFLQNERVTKLSIGEKLLNNIPLKLGELDQLITLELHNNDIEMLPETLGDLRNLKGLYLDGNDLENLPLTISNLTNLKELNLDGNALLTVPTVIYNLNALKFLSLADNELESITKEIGEVNNLLELDLSNNLLVSIPTEIGGLSELMSLNLRENKELQFIPKPICDLEATGTELLKDEHAVCVTNDYLTLRTLYEANPNNKLSWNLDDPTMETWEGIVKDDGIVYEIELLEKNLSIIPEEIGNLTSLTHLNLVGNGIAILPETIGDLKYLEELYLDENELILIPETIGNLSDLQLFMISINNLTTIPSSIGKLINLSNLNLSGNQLITLPKELGNLYSLQLLILRENSLESIPKEVCDLQEDIDGNGISTEITGIGTLCDDLAKKIEYEALVALYDANPNAQMGLGWDITDTTMTDWEGVTLNQEGRVKGLLLVKKGITNIPPEFRNLTSLTIINLNRNNISELPSTLGNLRNLTTLHLDTNKLEILPVEIGDLAHLQFLYLQSNDLVNLPESIGNLQNLKTLFLGGNEQLEFIPESIGDLSQLLDLSLNSCSIHSLPKTLRNIKTLQALYAVNNQLQEIPIELSLLINLRVLWLDNNNLKTLDSQFGNLAQLTEGSFSLRENPLESIPPEVCVLNPLLDDQQIADGICQ